MAQLPSIASPPLYDAFISYSWAKDRPLVAKLQGSLQRLGKPWWRRRALHVFRDDTSLSATPALWPSIVKAMAQSRYMILLASPEAARSHWVDQEVGYWLAHKDADTLLIALSAGDLAWLPDRNDFNWNEATPLPPCLRAAFASEPKWIDLRAFRTAAGDLRHDDTFLGAAADLAAAIHGMPKEDLLSEEVRQQRRALRLAYGAAASLGLIALIAAGLGAGFYLQRNLAVDRLAQTQISQSRFLADRARESLESDTAKAALLAIAGLPDPGEGADRPAIPETERMAYEALAGLREVAVLDHPDGLVSAEFTADGRSIVSASQDGTVGVWDAATGAASVAPERRSVELTRAIPSRDGTLIAACSEKGAIWLVDLRSGATRATLEGHTDSIRSASFSPDGARLLTASKDSTARVWDVASGRELLRLAHGANVWSAAYSPDGQTIVTASEDRTARLWDAASGHARLVLDKHEAGLLSASFSPDGNRILTASFDNTARIWDARTGAQLHVLAGHPDKVLDASFSRDGRKVLTVAGMELRLWDATSGEEVGVPRRHAGYVFSGQFSPDGTLAATTAGNRVHVWDLAAGKELVVLRGHQGALSSALFSPDGSRLVTAAFDRTARVWRLASLLAPKFLPVKNPRRAVFSPGGADVLIAARESAVVWRPEREITVSLQAQALTAAAFSPDGRLALTAAEDGTVRLWNLAAGRQVGTLDGHKDSVSDAAFSPDGTRIATVADDDTARLWDATSLRPLAVLPVEAGGARVVFSADSQRLVTVGSDTRVWDAASGREKAVLKLNGADFSGALAADVSRVAIISGQNMVVWEIASGRRVSVLSGHTGRVSQAAFNRDGTRLVTASGDWTARIWDVASGTELARLEHQKMVRNAVFAPDGNRVATTTDDGVRIWPVFAHPQGVLEHAKQHLPRCLSPGDLERAYLPAEPPGWCITGPGRRAETDPARWQPRWPYRAAAAAWKDWWAAKRSGREAPVPPGRQN